MGLWVSFFVVGHISGGGMVGKFRVRFGDGMVPRLHLPEQQPMEPLSG